LVAVFNPNVEELTLISRHWSLDGESELIPEQKGRYITTVEFNGQGTEEWYGNGVSFPSRVEQLQLCLVLQYTIPTLSLSTPPKEVEVRL